MDLWRSLSGVIFHCPVEIHFFVLFLGRSLEPTIRQYFTARINAFFSCSSDSGVLIDSVRDPSTNTDIAVHEQMLWLVKSRQPSLVCRPACKTLFPGIIDKFDIYRAHGRAPYFRDSYAIF